MNIIAKNIKFLRKRYKLSQQELAGLIGVNRSNIAAYESKNVEPKLQLLVKMSRWFDVAIEDFVTVDLSKQQDKMRTFKYSEGEAKSISKNALFIHLYKNPELFNRYVTTFRETQKAIHPFDNFMDERINGYTEMDKDITRFLVNITDLLDVVDHLLKTNGELINHLQELKNELK